MKRILIVEDDALLNKTLAYNLTSDGYAVYSAFTAEAAQRKLESGRYDLVLLDINLPDGNGYDLCQFIKSGDRESLVIFLTANDQESDLIRGYELGALDYITKPFSVLALQKKVRAMFALLDGRGSTEDIFDDGNLYINFTEQVAHLKGESLSLSPLEFRLLHLFCKNPKRVMTRGFLLEKLWDLDEKFVEGHTLTTTVSRVRGKIEGDERHYIKTVYGMGYQWIGDES